MTEKENRIRKIIHDGLIELMLHIEEFGVNHYALRKVEDKIMERLNNEETN
jgi:hypothetical protein